MAPEKPKNAQNMKALRELLGLSQSEMAIVLGGVPQGSYKMWELKTKTPTKIRDALFASGVNLNWFDSGEGDIFRPGVERIRVVRDDLTGKPISLLPVNGGPQNDVQESRSTITPEGVTMAWSIFHEACGGAGARPDLMPVKGAGRLLAMLSERASTGEGPALRAALLEEARDLVGAMAQGVAPK